MKTILGLDIGTNSIGWALVSEDDTKKKILGIGSRIIPMDGAEIIEFQKGNAQTKNADRRILKGIRKLNKRYKQRRNKLIYVLQQMDILPEQFHLTEAFNNPKEIQKVCIKPINKGSVQPTALDLIELRVKALQTKIEEKELGKLLYWFNQLRGYAGGGEENEDVKETDDDIETDDAISNKIKKYEKIVQAVKILDVVKEELKPEEKRKPKFTIKADIGEGEILSGETELENLVIDETLELQIIIRRNQKTGKETSVNFSLPKKTDWRKKMEDLENILDELKTEKGREVFISEYFLSLLNQHRWTKIRNNVILRSRYQAEFDAIWKEQSKHHSFLNNLDKTKLTEIANFLFPGEKETQLEYKKDAIEKGLNHIIRNQIIYYQRELKDQTDLISTCRFEPTEKVVAKSHPIFQEYKIWEQINKLSINTKIEKGKNKKGEMKYDYIDKPIPTSLKEWLYDELQNKKEIKFSVVLNKLQKEYGLRDKVDFLNGMNAKASIKGNDTRLLLKKQLGELWQTLKLENEDNLIEFWDILYNGKGNEYDLNSDRTSKILSFIKKHNPNLPNIEKLAIQLAKIKFARTYSAMSLKAIKNILPLVRAGKHYDNREFSSSVNAKIETLSSVNVEGVFEKAVQEYLERNETILAEGGIVNAFATILVYDKHTAKEYKKEELFTDYKKIERLKQGELRNPLVEQVINETLMVVKDIWKEYKIKPTEIRVELARELKNNADERSKIFKANTNNQKTNARIKDRLKELEVEMSLSNIERYKLWSTQEGPEAKAILNDPSKNDIEKMKLWEEQGLVSPYTGNPIPLSDLFNKGKVDIDHIIPKSRYFDDSLTNKVICETAINKDKGNRTAMEYFEVGSNVVKIKKKEDFIDDVNARFYGRKRKNLLATKIPEDPIARQLKETQYISVRVKEELNKIVGNENVKTSTGGVTDYLRTHWGLTEEFKTITRQRFEDISPKLATIEYDTYKKELEAKKKEAEKNDSEFTEELIDQDTFIKAFNDNFIKYKNNKLIISKWSKRFDHRHHAIDALVVACTEQKHIQRLNNLNKALQDWLIKNRDKLNLIKEGTSDELLEAFLNLENEKRELILKEIDGFRNIELPWAGFKEEAARNIESIIVSHKPKERLLTQIGKPQNGKECEPVLKIRGALHDATLYGKSGNEECYRIPLSKFAGQKFATTTSIEKIVHPFLKSVIKQHLEVNYKGDKKEAFSAEGIGELNKTLKNKTRKNKKGILVPAPHPPIDSIKIYYKSQDETIALKKLAQKSVDTESIINDVIDGKLKEDLLNHYLKIHQSNKKEAFSESGIKLFNSSRSKAIKSVKVKSKDEKDAKGETEKDALQKLDREKSFNQNLYVKTGGNYCFAILEKDGNRIYDIISFYDAAKILKDEFIISKDKLSINTEVLFKNHFQEKNKDAKTLFLLKQNDLVYLPQKDEEVIFDTESPLFKIFWEDYGRISSNVYSVVKFSKKQIYFIKHSVAKAIENKLEFGTQNCYEIVNEISIKDKCIPIKLNRLGHLIEVNGNIIKQ